MADIFDINQCIETHGGETRQTAVVCGNDHIDLKASTLYGEKANITLLWQYL